MLNLEKELKDGMREDRIESTSIYPVVYRRHTLFQSALNTDNKLQKSTYFKANTLFAAAVSLTLKTA